MKRLHLRTLWLAVAVVPACSPVGVATATNPQSNMPPASSTAASDLPGSDGWINTTIRQKLSAATDPANAGIRVETRGGMVKLSGHVPQQADADRAVMLARAVDGVISVDDSSLVVGAAEHQGPLDDSFN